MRAQSAVNSCAEKEGGTKRVSDARELEGLDTQSILVCHLCLGFSFGKKKEAPDSGLCKRALFLLLFSSHPPCPNVLALSFSTFVCMIANVLPFFPPRLSFSHSVVPLARFFNKE
jgi:hypothetical protein